MKAGCRVLDKAGCRTKSRQDVAARLFTKNKTATLLSLSPLACHEAACSGLAKRRSIKRSGRRGSNSRQPAWKAGTLPLSYSRISRGTQTRTVDLLVPNQARYQLRHTPSNTSELYHSSVTLSSTFLTKKYSIQWRVALLRYPLLRL